MNPTATVSWFGIHTMTITHRQNVQNFFDKLTYYDQENTQHLHEWIQTCFTMITEEPDNKASTTQHPTTTTRPRKSPKRFRISNQQSIDNASDHKHLHNLRAVDSDIYYNDNHTLFDITNRDQREYSSLSNKSINKEPRRRATRKSTRVG